MKPQTDNEKTAQALRNAADAIHMARAEMEYGSLNGPSHDIEMFVERLDKQMGELEETFRELASLAEVERDE